MHPFRNTRRVQIKDRPELSGFERSTEERESSRGAATYFTIGQKRARRLLGGEPSEGVEKSGRESGRRVLSTLFVGSLISFSPPAMRR